MPPLVVLDRQHSGHPTRRNSGGAWFDIDGDGRRDQWERETQLVPYYTLAAENHLREHGIDVIPISDGRYSERHERACAYGADIYVACHLNAGGGTWGNAFFDRRSTGGRALAQLAAAQLEVYCPELTSARSTACWDDRPLAGDNAWLWRPFVTIRGVYTGRPAGLCFEPAFMDQPAHAHLLRPEGLARVGLALATAILDHLGVHP